MKRPARIISINGIARTITEWAAITGMKRARIVSRLRRGWGTKAALNPHATMRGTYRLFPTGPLGKRPKKRGR